MVSWQQVLDEAPEFAATVQARFEIRKHATMATLRKDGSPRISGTEVEFEDGQLRLGSMPGALKARDLRRDPRIALHSPTDDPPEATPSDWSRLALLFFADADRRFESRGQAPLSSIPVSMLVIL